MSEDTPKRERWLEVYTQELAEDGTASVAVYVYEGDGWPLEQVGEPEQLGSVAFDESTGPDLEAAMALCPYVPAGGWEAASVGYIRRLAL